MFTKLMESSHRRRFRAGGSAVSIIAHASLVLAAVTLTANATTPAVPDDPEVVRQFVDVAPPTPAASTPGAAPPHAAATPVNVPAPTTIAVPIDIPIAIPPIAGIDLTNRDMDDLRFGRTNTSGETAGSAGQYRGTASVVGGTEVYAAHTVDKPVVLLPGATTPSYPELLRSAGVEGQVRLRFVVDTTGRIAISSIVVVTSDHDLFTAAVQKVLSGLRFLPAEHAGKKVRQLVELPFTFGLDR